MTKLEIAVIALAPIAAVTIGLVALYYAFKVDEHMFDGEIDFGPVDF